MKSGILIIGAIVIALCLVPLFLFRKGRNKKKSALKKAITDLASEKSCHISEYDTWDDMMIGIDREKHWIFFIDNQHGKEEKLSVNIKEVSKARVLTLNRTEGAGKSKQDVTDNVCIALSFNDQSKKDKMINFFSSNSDSFSIGPELLMANKWLKIIQDEILSANKKK